MTAPVLYANTDLVMQAWLAAVPGLSTDMVGATLPIVSAWQDKQGFVTERALPGADNHDYPLNGPVVTLDIYSYRAGSARPPWHQANNLASAIWFASRNRNAPAMDLTFPGGYPPARVTGIWGITSPRRAYGDQGNFAHFVMDLQVKWVQL